MKSLLKPVRFPGKLTKHVTHAITVTNNHFMWFVPRDWDSTQITLFTQHAASVGIPGFALFMDLSTRVDGPGYKCYPHEPLAEGCRDNLDRWMKTVYYGVETRVLVNGYPMRRDDGMIAHFLHQAQQVSIHTHVETLGFFMSSLFRIFLDVHQLTRRNVVSEAGKELGSASGEPEGGVGGLYGAAGPS